MKPWKKSPKYSLRGFTIYEALIVIVTIGLVAILAALGASMLGKWRKRSAMSTCIDNLHKIGTAMSVYASDNLEEMPYAGVKYSDMRRHSWDDLLDRQLSEGRPPEDLDAPISSREVRLLRCPSDVSDKIWSKSGGFQRSYAMPLFQKSKSNWPPNSASETGIGIQMYVSNATAFVQAESGYSLAERFSTATNSFPVITKNILTQPAATIALAERVHPRNLVGSTEESTIPNATEHIHYQLPIPFETYHGMKFNYLMVDGHVESLHPLETLSNTNSPAAIQSGKWTISARD